MRPCNARLRCPHTALALLGIVAPALIGCPNTEEVEPQRKSSESIEAQQTCDDGSMDDCVSEAIALQSADDGQDLPRARRLFARACEAKHPEGCRRLGFLQFKGHGGARDIERARKSWTTGCDLDDDMSCYQLGLSLMLGEGSDMERAKESFAQGCALGNQAACVKAKQIEFARRRRAPPLRSPTANE